MLAICLLFFAVQGVQAQASYGLQYVVGSKGAAYQGQEFTAANNFTNTGTVQIQVLQITITTDFGTFTPTGLPLSISPGQKRTLEMQIQVPSTASVGNHPLSASASFQYLDPSTSQWVTPNESPIVLQTTLTVSQGQSTSLLILGAIFGTIAALVAVVVVLAVKLRRRRRSETMFPAPQPPPPPATAPPASPPQ